MKSKLKISIDKTQQVFMEETSDFGSSIFKEIYHEAVGHVIQFVKNSNLEGSLNSKPLNSITYQEDFYYQTFSNIISFIGDRGSGKTSSLMSFTEALVSGKYKDMLKDESDKDATILEHVRFHSTDMIDPTLFKDKSDLLSIIVTNMFRKFKDYCVNEEVNQNRRINQEKKQSLLKLFAQVHNSLKIISSKDDALKDLNAIEALNKTSATSELKLNMYRLILEYTSFISQHQESYGNSHNYLVIRIDDLDLKPDYAYEMVEQIRKYLMIPNVLIFIALDIEQFNESLLNHIKSKKINLSEQYLEKVFPEEHRLYMPELSNANSVELIVSERVTIDNRVVEIVKFKTCSISVGIRELIYTKTGLLFQQSDAHSTSKIVPTSLRNIVNMVSWLWNMEDTKPTTRSLLDFYCRYNGIEIEIIDKYSSEEQSRRKGYPQNAYDDVLKPLSLLLEAKGQAFGERTVREITKLNKLIAKNNDVEKINRSIVNEIALALNAKLDDDEYHNLMNMIKAIDNISIKNKTIMHKNRERFVEYFCNNWMISKLTDRQFGLAKQWREIDDQYKNKFIVRELYNLINIQNSFIKPIGDEKNATWLRIKNRMMTREDDVEYIDITFPTNNPQNISLGDVMFIFDYCLKLKQANKMPEFIFAMKFLYTNRLFKYYNRNVESGLNILDIDEQYFEIIGGSIFNSIHYKLLPNGNSKFNFGYEEYINGFINDNKVILKSILLGEDIKNTDDEINDFISALELFECIHYCLESSREMEFSDRLNSTTYYSEKVMVTVYSEKDNIYVVDKRSLKKRKMYFDPLGYVVNSIKGIEKLNNYTLEWNNEHYKIGDFINSIYLKLEKSSPVYKRILDKTVSVMYIGNIELLEKIFVRSTHKHKGDFITTYIDFLYNLEQNHWLIDEPFKMRSFGRNNFTKTYADLLNKHKNIKDYIYANKYPDEKIEEYAKVVKVMKENIDILDEIMTSYANNSQGCEVLTIIESNAATTVKSIIFKFNNLVDKTAKVCVKFVNVFGSDISEEQNCKTIGSLYEYIYLLNNFVLYMLDELNYRDMTVIRDIIDRFKSKKHIKLKDYLKDKEFLTKDFDYENYHNDMGILSDVIKDVLESDGMNMEILFMSKLIEKTGIEKIKNHHIEILNHFEKDSYGQS